MVSQMVRDITIKKIHTKCCNCNEELLEGTTCYEHDGYYYCEFCFDKFLENLKKECETKAEDYEQWS